MARATYGNTWWGEQWLKALTHIDHDNRLPRGRSYANKGAVKDLKQADGMLKAKVQGSRPSPYQVTIQVPPLSQKQARLSLKAGGTGLNLTAASNVIHFDLWLNPAVEAQATDRAYRIGQQRNVQVHRFVTSGTFEERINEMIQRKRELAELTVATGEQWIGNLDTEELQGLFALG
ncbi:helicase-related protein [Chromobacterium amazonense]|uniref:SWIM zinc finger family protein n=1 Tax=Chromobacterium amazonense TaxID=1382803 RepID=UPI0031F621EB